MLLIRSWKKKAAAEKRKKAARSLVLLFGCPADSLTLSSPRLDDVVCYFYVLS